MTGRLQHLLATMPGACGTTGCYCAAFAVCPAEHCRAIVEEARLIHHRSIHTTSGNHTAQGLAQVLDKVRADIVEAAAAMRRHFTATHCNDCIAKFDDAHARALAGYDKRFGTTPTPHAGDDGGSGS